MKTLLLIALLLAGIGIGYPLVNEETSNACSALERRLITTLSAQEGDTSSAIVLGALQDTLSNGSLARSLVKLRSPDMPPVIACGPAYWRLVLDRNSAEAMLNELVTAKQIGGKPANTAADELIRTIDPKAAAAAEAQKAMRALTNPTAPPGPASVPPPDSAPAPSYRPGDKRELDRLLGTQR